MTCKTFTPHPYQQYCINRIVESPTVGLFLDMGLGKTAITLMAIRCLKFDCWAVNRVLVVAPKKVAEATWQNEAATWEQTQGLRVVEVLGAEAHRRRVLATQADVYFINRENIPWLVQECGRAWPFDMVVLDESSSFKNPRSHRFRALKTVRPKIHRLVELTGTPTSNGLMDLWAQIYLLDGGQRLGRTITAYREIYFTPDKRNRTQIFSYRPKAGAQEDIYRQLSDICISMKAADYLSLPDCITDNIPVVLDKAAKQAYDRLERDALLEVEDGVITAGSAGVLTGKLLQLCNGAVYDENGDVQTVHDCKIAAFLEVVEQLGGQHALVFYGFKHDADRLQTALKSTGLRVRVYGGAEDAQAWNAGEVDILLAHPASCAYGLNLQAGGHHVIWFSLTWALEQYQQANKRLHRQGQTEPCIIHNLIVQGGVDEDVIRALDRKEDAQDSLLSALKVKVKSAREAVQ